MYCRCPLQKVGFRSLKRGQRGVVSHVYHGHYLCTFIDDDNTVFHSAVAERFLEPSPGTFSLGFNRILESRDRFYRLGPLVSDLRFPEPWVAAHERYNDHCLRLMRSGFGFSFYDGINALAMSESMSAMYGQAHHRINLDPDYLGLIICEHPWTRANVDRWQFLTSLARSFLSQYSTIPEILEMRVSQELD